MKTENEQEKTEGNNQIEFSKLQGFDVLEKLPDERLESTYNEQFYNSLSNLKFLSMTVPEDNKLFYRFEQNENASVSTTTGQVLKTYQDLFIENETIKKVLRTVKKEIVNIFGSYESIDETVIGMVKPEIDGMERRLQNYLVEQKTENFRLIKELGILEKEKEELTKGIESAIERLERLENEVGYRLNNTNENKRKDMYQSADTSQDMHASNVDINKFH